MSNNMLCVFDTQFYKMSWQYNWRLKCPQSLKKEIYEECQIRSPTELLKNASVMR